MPCGGAGASLDDRERRPTVSIRPAASFATGGRPAGGGESVEPGEPLRADGPRPDEAAPQILIAAAEKNATAQRLEARRDCFR